MLRAAFSLTELLVVIAILALLAATQLPALTRAKAPVKFTQCMNNVRQIGAATMLYLQDNNDTYPFGQRLISTSTFAAETGWPRLLLKYMGGYTTNEQPAVLVCPSETRVVSAPMQLHFQGNREIIRDTNDADAGMRGSQIRRPAIYWVFMEKGPYDFGNIRPGALENPELLYWNYPPGSPGYRRHNGGLTAAAADGHAEYLRMPPYLADSKTIPQNFMELGDCSIPPNPASSGVWRDNGPRAKLFCRARPGGGF
jgi:prepilin-type N-terminal cleavage/methylation domain-containing protein/prepilin-type processing-associated H-X9-DG protein